MEMLVSNPGFKDILSSFKGKRVFVTGHTGFKGSWLCLLLNMAGAEIKGYSLAPDQENSLYEGIEPSIKIQSVISDIRNRESLSKAINSFQPDFLFHLAAQPLVRYSYENPIETFETNVTGTANVLDALRLLQNKCTSVIITTDKVYENNEFGDPFKESDPLGGHDPYSSSKACAEIVCQSYQKSFFPTDKIKSHGQSIATARAGNVIGGGDRAKDRIIPDLIRALETNEVLQIRNPEAIRPWQHVLDPLAGYLTLAYYLNIDAVTYTGSYNFGPEEQDTLPVREIVKLAIQTWGSGEYKENIVPNQPHEAGTLKLDITKAKQQLHWQPKWNSVEAVVRTMGWYKKAQNDKQFYSLCVDEINAFML